MKRYILLLCILSAAPFVLLTAKRKTEHSTRSVKKKSASVDDLFNVQDEAQLPKPVFKEPSPFMSWVRAKGIAFLYWTITRYKNCKAWCADRYRLLFKAYPQGSRLP